MMDICLKCGANMSTKAVYVAPSYRTINESYCEMCGFIYYPDLKHVLTVDISEDLKLVNRIKQSAEKNGTSINEEIIIMLDACLNFEGIK
jgi:spore coat polysaccharide biosynthesis protein SpsF (cytidylyltransferase family)